ncbi:MAG: tryptophan--tRNA ligase [Bacillota bacterium]|nr:tryptophan--tRNA ligase [Bacillota bacterium]
MYSGIKPSGRLTLGNYIGSINQWKQMQDDYNCIYCVADLHAITERQEPESLREISVALFAQYVSAGIDPDKSIMYFQSHVSEHAELSWILSCLTYMGELNRMTQYKVKSQKGGDNLNAGLFTYPILMASDILLYQTDYVPVGDDQTQHVELTRDIAIRFNNRYESQLFTVPEAVNPKVGARIMSLQEPTKKMSKSDENANASIYIVDSDDLIAKKIKKAVTDSEGTIKYNENRPAIRNLMEIYSSLSEKSYEEIEALYDGRGYGDFKSDLSDLVISKIAPIRNRYLELMNDKAELEKIYRRGADQAREIAVKTLDNVKSKCGFILR